MDDFGIADGASGLDDGGCAGLGYGLEAVGEWKEGVGGGYAAGEREDGLHGSKACCVAAGHLAGSYAYGLAVTFAESGVDDGVGFDVLADAPGEEERAELFGGGVAVGDGLEVGLGDAEVGGVLDEEAAGDLLGDARGVGGGDLE